MIIVGYKYAFILSYNNMTVNDSLYPFSYSFFEFSIDFRTSHLNAMGRVPKYIRSASIDTGSECLLKSIKTETFRTLARKDIEEKLFQGMYPKHWNIRQNIRIISNVIINK